MNPLALILLMLPAVFNAPTSVRKPSQVQSLPSTGSSQPMDIGTFQVVLPMEQSSNPWNTNQGNGLSQWPNGNGQQNQFPGGNNGFNSGQQWPSNNQFPNGNGVNQWGNQNQFPGTNGWGSNQPGQLQNQQQNPWGAGGSNNQGGWGSTSNNGWGANNGGQQFPNNNQGRWGSGSPNGGFQNGMGQFPGVQGG